MNKLKLTVTLLLSVLVLSCRSSITHDLDLAEAYFAIAPDSSLAILEGMDRRTIHRHEDLARYALLKSAALDKNYRDVTSDSLIRVALDYYEKTRNEKYRMLSWYYEGIILKNAQEYASAAVALEKSLRLSLHVGDPLYSGLIHRNMASLFNSTNNNEEAIRHMQNAIHYFDVAGQQRYKAFAEMSLATLLANSEEFSGALQLIRSIRKQNSDPILQDYCNLREASVLVKQDTLPSRALSLFMSVPLRLFSVMDYSYYALAYEMMQQPDSAQLWMERGYSLCKDLPDSASLDYMRSRIELKRNNYQEAYILIDHAASIQDSLTRILLRQSISAAQRDYYRNETALQEERVKGLSQRYVFTIIITLLILSTLVLLSAFHARKKDRQLKDQMADLVLRGRMMDQLQKDNAHLVGSLFSEKVDHLDTLCGRYFQEEDYQQKESIYKEIKRLVSLLRKDPELYAVLQRDLDRYCNMIMNRLRAQVPRIKGENLQLITLFFAGFSYEIVQLLLNKSSIASLKTARTRLRKVILDAKAPDAELFLKMLEMKSGRRPLQMKT